METIIKAGKKFVLVPLKQWEQLAGSALPSLPRADSDGNVPAVEYARASIARQIISERMALGLSQAELARQAGVQVETLNRIEKDKVTPDTTTIAKIDKVLHPRGVVRTVRR